MENPFAFNNYVTGEAFCNRKKELTDLLMSMKGSQNVLLYSHRRIGKSSLIRQAFHEINKQKALSSLMRKEIITKNGNYRIQDILFKKWLEKTLLLEHLRDKR